jgi:hypothetical protein
VVLAVVFGIASAAPQAQGSTAPMFGRAALTRAVASATSPQLPTVDWERLTRVAFGREVFVAVGDQPARSWQFLAVDPSSLTLLDVSALPADARRAMVQIARENAGALSANSREIVERGDVRLAPDGLFLRGRKLCDKMALTQVLSRESVREVSVASRDQRAEMFVVAGVLFGAAIAVNARASAQQCGCGDAVFTKTGLGLSIGGIAALVSASHTSRLPAGARTILYRRP